MVAYIVVSSFDEPSNLRRGVTITKQFIEDGGKLELLHTDEDILMDTGTASESYHLMVAGDNLLNVQEIRKKFQDTFITVLQEFYQDDNISNAIDFDDCVLSENMPLFLEKTIKRLEANWKIENVCKTHPYYENQFYKLTK